MEVQPIAVPNKIFLTFWIAVAYVLGAQIGFVLALLPNVNITLLWPPSGIALASVLIWRHRALPGIFVGAFLTFMIELQSAPAEVMGTTGDMLAVVLSLACSTTLATMIAGRLLQRFAPSAPVWNSASDILYGSFCMGIACTVSAFLGVGSASLAGYLPTDAIDQSFGMWWLGEFCGMMIFTPLAFAVARRQTAPFWRRLRPELALSPTILSSAFAAASLAIFLLLWTLEGANITRSLQREASTAANSFYQALYAAGRDLESIRAFLYAAESVDEDEFLRYTTNEFGMRQRFSETQAVGWAPRVTHPRAWELELLAKGESDAVLFELDSNGARIPVKNRKEYFPVQFIYPLNEVNRRAIGFDLGSEKIRREALHRCRDTGKVSIAAPIYLVQSEKNAPSLLICSAIYFPGASLETVADRRENLSAFSAGVYDIGFVFEQALTEASADVDFHLLDKTLPTGKQWYYTRISPFRAAQDAIATAPTLTSLTSGFNGIARIDIPEQQWIIVATPGVTFISSHRNFIPWGALLLILALGIGVSSILVERIASQKVIDAERLRTEQALLDARAANESKSYFMAAASHDIKQPLYALSILTDTLLMSDPPESTKPIIKAIRKSIQQMSQHFDTLMDVGRFQDGGFEAVKSSVNLADLASRIDMEIAPLCKEKGLNWILDFDNVRVVSDAELLLRLMRNLLTNAVRYTDAGEVCCIGKVQGDFVKFRISDTGRGLSSAQKELIDNPSVQVIGNHLHTSWDGLGLSIVTKINQSLDLGLQIRSDKDRGTAYSFKLPRAS